MLDYGKLIAAAGLLLACAGTARAQEQGATAVDPQKTQQELSQLREYVMDAEGAVQTAVSDVNTLKKIKLSGYAQIRWNAPQGTASTFALRRARLKVAASPTEHTQIVLQPDFAGQDPSANSPDKSLVTMKDVAIEWFPTAATQEMSWTFTLGQTVLPFGYENVASSSTLLLGERAAVVRNSFPDEYDKGLKVATPATWPVTAQLGIFNGVGPNNRSGQGWTDVNPQKDVVGRVRYSPLGNLDLGGSFYVGRQTAQTAVAGTAAVAPKVVGFIDGNGNKVFDAGETQVYDSGTAAVAAKPQIIGNRLRWGVDAQWWPVNNLALQFEYIAGTNPAAVSNGLASRKVHGLYAQAAYSFLKDYTGVVKYDTYRDGTGAGTANSDIWHLGLVRYLTSATRVLFLYDFQHERFGPRVKNNVARVEVVSLF